MKAKFQDLFLYFTAFKAPHLFFITQKLHCHEPAFTPTLPQTISTLDFDNILFTSIQQRSNLIQFQFCLLFVR